MVNVPSGLSVITAPGSPCAELPADQVAGLGDDHRGSDERAGIGFQQLPAGLVVAVVAVRGGQQRAGVDEEHSAAPKTLSEQLISLRAAPG